MLGAETTGEERAIWRLVEQLLAVAKHQKPPPQRMLAACVVLAAEISVNNGQTKRGFLRLAKREWDCRAKQNKPEAQQ